MSDSTTTTDDVAAWMAAQLERRGTLDQRDAVEEIEKTFGADFVYENENGNLAIDKKVLRKFRKLTEGVAVWDRWGFCWEKRTDNHNPGRKQE